MLNTSVIHTSAVFAALLLLASSAQVSSAPDDFEAIVVQAREAPAERRTQGEGPATRNQLLELQSILLAYADQYMSVLAEACDIVEERVQTSEARSKAHSFKSVAALAGLSIATGPNPEAGLLDMVAMVTLERMVAEEPGWQPDFGEHKKVVIEGLRSLEREIWSIAARYLTREQMRELRSLIEQWRAEHPRVTYVTYIRLKDFAGMRAESALLEAYESGLLLDISDALRAVDQTRLMAERALHYSERMPILFAWTTEGIFYELARTNEIQQMLGESSRVSKTLERFATVMEKLPDQVSAERHATLIEAADLMARERSALVEDMNREAQALTGLVVETRGSLIDANALLGEVQKTTLNGERLAAQIAEMTAVINETLKTADALLARFEPKGEQPPPGEPGKPFDITEYTASASELGRTVKELNTLALSLERLSTTTEYGDIWFDNAMTLGIALIVVFLVGLFVTLLAFRLTTRRMLRPDAADAGQR